VYAESAMLVLKNPHALASTRRYRSPSRSTLRMWDPTSPRSIRLWTRNRAAMFATGGSEWAEAKKR